MDESKYSVLVSKIKKRRILVIVLISFVFVIAMFFTSAGEFSIMGETFVSDGVHPVFTILLIGVYMFAMLFAVAAVSMPLATSMDQECDPEKQIVLYKKLHSQKNIDHIYSRDYFYLGDYSESLKYAEKMIKSTNSNFVLSGLFNKARCEFFLGEYDSFCETVKQYTGELANCNKLYSAAEISYKKINNLLDLMVAISENNIERINALRNNVEVWNTSKATEGLVNFFKGLSAYKIGEKQEAIHRFMLVKEACSKTVLLKLSDEYLSLLN